MKIHSVMVVDDEAIVRESIADWLRNAGYNVATAETGEEALELVEKQDFSVMVMDIRLPGQSGVQVLKQIKAQRPWIKSIIITAYPSMETSLEAIKLNVVDYLIKPFAPDDLERLIRETLDSVETKPKPPEVTEVRPIVEKVEVKKSFAISRANLAAMVNSLIGEMKVIGVKPKHGKYVYDGINDFSELALDYDVTAMPPGRYLLPARETLLRFEMGDDAKTRAVTESSPAVLIGVHPYDIKAIELIDEAFMTTNPDPSYIARRQNTTIIGVDCLNPSPNSFARSMGTNQAENGFDLLLTDLGDSYMVTVGSQKGAAILNRHAQVREPTADEVSRQKTLREEAQSKFRLSLDIAKELLPRILEDSYDDPYWESRSRSCLSCGSCVMVCPTCFCFDVQDDVSLNMKAGERVRQWDGCVLVDFARVASGENFRHDKTSRFRHRIYRKGKYVLERYGKPGCVGCGRCATTCLPGIASPLEAFNSIAETVRNKEAAKRLVRQARPPSDLYVPQPAALTRVVELTPREKVFDFVFADGHSLEHRPGQFVEVSIMGIGNAPISISSSPTRGESFQLGVRKVGKVTDVLHSLKARDTVGIRGPFGNGFPLETLTGRDVLMVAGGIGLFPMRSMVQYVLDRRDQFGRAVLIFGSRSPAERLLADELAEWSQRPDIEFHETVDKGDENWKGNVGIITTLIPRINIEPRNSVAVVVGPPIMYRFVIVELRKKGFTDENIILSLERRMKCGIGKCGHCQINGVYVCQEGPVFSLAQLRRLREAV